MNRNNTNQLLKDLAIMTEQDQDLDEATQITVVAGGQLITGTLISEDQFFALDQNIALQHHFKTEIKEKRERMLESAELPEELREYFLYLKDAFYLFGSSRVPAPGQSLSIQVRVSDISAFSYIGFK